MANEKGQLYKDKAKTTGLYPYTKVSCITDDNDNSLISLLGAKQNNVLYGTTEPSASLGNDGDIYLLYEV